MSESADWTELADWWESEVATDATYRRAVIPLVLELLPAAGRFVDLGCGQGQVMEAARSPQRTIIGCDINRQLASEAARFGPVVQTALPGLTWLAPASLDGCVAVLVVEHLADLEPLFAAAAEVTRPGGTFVLVANHPYVTAPGSTSVVDPSDGEVFWRWGRYLTEGKTQEPAGSETVVFHHRPLGEILTTAARAGWSLRSLREVDTPDAGEGLADAGLPRLVGVAWERSI